MPKQSQRVEFNTFVKGLITEAGSLNFPPNASSDEENFVLYTDGSRARRLGLDAETSASFLNLGTTSPASLGRSTFKWLSAGGDPNRNLLVQQIGNTLYLYNLSTTSISGSGYFSSITLSSLSTTVNYSFASVEGKLVVVSNNPLIAVVNVSSSNVLSSSYVRLKVRDMWGLECLIIPAYENDPTYRDASNNDLYHVYNLHNQGWKYKRISFELGYGSGLVDPVQEYWTRLNCVPSESEVIWTGLQFRSGVGDGGGGTNVPPYECIMYKMFDQLRGITTVAPKGFYIIDLLDRGASRVSASYTSDGLPTSIVYTRDDRTSGGASVVEEFSGHVFYSGFQGDVLNPDARSPNLSNYVAFSQLVRNTNNIWKCYQEADPTSRDDSDVVDTDGGTMRISGARKIVALKNMSSHLVVFADNGVWAITGGSDFGFSATNYKVSKLSNYGCISASSVVTEGDRTYFMSDTGIYVIGRSQMGELVVESITNNTIQSYYDSIPLASKQTATVVYDTAGKKIRWLYKTGTQFTSNSYSYEIVFDIRLGAFSRNKIYPSSTNDSEAYSLFTDSFNTLKFSFIRKSGSNYYLSFAEYKNTAFKDWNSTDASAYVITGALTGGDSAVEKQAPYLIMHFERTETGTDTDAVPLNQSSCFVRSQWEWADTINSKKWGTLFQAYRYRTPLFSSPNSTYENGFEMITTKNKLRGRGRALSLYMQTESGKDCRILGWNLSINGNEAV